MGHLTKREQTIFLINLALAVTAIIGLLWAILYQQQLDNCWNKYTTEKDAIQNCEVRNV